MSRPVFGVDREPGADGRTWPRDDCGLGNHLIGDDSTCTECGYFDRSKRRWVQARRAGVSVPADDAMSTAIAMGGAAIHAGDCGLGTVLMECTCTPQIIGAGARA